MIHVNGKIISMLPQAEHKEHVVTVMWLFWSMKH